MAESCPASSSASPSSPSESVLDARQACVDVGYLCADLDTNDEIRLQRWHDLDGPLVVHVPLPEEIDRSVARGLQRAAAQGVRLWNNQPFPILADLRGDRDPHFSIRWTPSLGGSQLGVARTRWTPAGGLEVLSLELATRSPFGRRSFAEPRQVRLTAAHEMGHALGLSHSGSTHDVMYPTNTATSLSAQDYRTIEALYARPDGTRIRR